MSLGGFGRAAVFDVTADVLRRATSSQFAQLFILASDPHSEDSSEHGLTLLAHTSKGYRSFPLDALTLGAVTVSCEPASLMQHADEFWSWDKSSLAVPVRGKFYVMLHPLVDAAGKVYGVVQVCAVLLLIPYGLNIYH